MDPYNPCSISFFLFGTTRKMSSIILGLALLAVRESGDCSTRWKLLKIEAWMCLISFSMKLNLSVEREALAHNWGSAVQCLLKGHLFQGHKSVCKDWKESYSLTVEKQVSFEIFGRKINKLPSFQRTDTLLKNMPLVHQLPSDNKCVWGQEKQNCKLCSW